MFEPELKNIKGILADEHIRKFAEQNLKNSLHSIGFSENLIKELIFLFDDLNIEPFVKKHEKELEEIHTKRFFQKIVPDYFQKYIVPEIPEAEKVVDVGCGTGVLLRLLSVNTQFKKLIGIDLNPYPEWELFVTERITFKIVEEIKFKSFLAVERPNIIVLTWTLHHMPFEEQKRYLKYIYSNMEKDSVVVVLEDAYSSKMAPETGKDKHEAFMEFNKNDRIKLVSFYDWVANRILARRKLVPMPFSFRALEEWEQLFAQNGFETVNKKYIGFPEQRDINTPQSLLVVKKIF